MKRSLLSYLSPSLRSVRGPLLLGLLAPAGGVLAQTPPVPAPASTNLTELPPVVVTASPIPSSLFDLAQPVTVLTEEKLRQQMASTLGETLARQPGINSTYFGPNASRPIIRGLGGDRVRILQNGLGTMDVSNVSDDHAVSMDPIALKRVEVVRGPAALLYGPNAVGGVVNQIDNRIPEQRIERPLTGKVVGRYDSASSGKVGSLLVEGGSKQGFNYHFDAFRRESDNIIIPGFALTPAQQVAQGVPGATGRLPGSQATSDGGAGGASYVWDKGFVGGSYQGFNNDYGVVLDPAVNIRLHQRRWDLAGAFLQPMDGLQSLRWKFGRANYRHTEYDAGAVGTVFNSDAYNGRFEALHAQIGRFEGAVGYEIRQDKLSATGAEAFLPPTSSSVNSLFVFEEVKWEKVSLQFGGRVDFVGVDASAVAGHPRFTANDSRSFTTGSGSVGLVYRPVEEYSGAVNFAYTQRAATAQELYANGPHAATGVYELGNRSFNSEGNLGIDLSLRKETGRITGELGFFYNRFSNFLTLVPGTLGGLAVVDDTGAAPAPGADMFNVMRFQGLPAEFMGAEGMLTFHLVHEETQRLHLNLKSDYVRARDSRTGAALPRISPLRYGSELVYVRGAFEADCEVQRVERQGRVSAGELPTPGYVMLNLGVAYHFGEEPGSVELSLRGMNLLDQSARNHVSFLKEVAPMPGRGAVVALRATF